MIVNIDDFQNEFKKYYDIAKSEEVVIIENRQAIIKLVPLKNEEASITKSLIGAFKKCKDADLDDIREERLKKYEDIN